MNRLKNSLVYLSGPMDRVLDWNDAVTWRNDLKEFLFNKNVGVLDPCDKACAFGVENEGTRDLIKKLKEEERYDEIVEIMKPICSIDLRMVDIAHFVILYIDLDVFMTGSFHESFMGIAQKKPVLVVCKQGKKNIPNWMFGVNPHELMFSNWIELKDYLQYIDTAEIVEHFKRWRFIDMDYVYGKTS